MSINNELFSYKQITASSIIKVGVCQFGGIFVSAASSTPTITIYDGQDTSGTKIIDTFTPSAATPYPFPIAAINGIYIVITGTVSLTAFYI